ncbi:MAG: UPF0149 family protein [Steroidobacteraceae bacterium]|nr:UPF0149 family protein [Steroidobacteraceae bacterium]
MLSVAFREVDRLLADADSEVDAAEAHGCLTGALCAAPGYRASDWIEEILQDGAVVSLDPRSAVALETLHAETLQSLGGGEMTFLPLLPDDDAPLASRVRALAFWCSGFLYGMGVGQVPSLEHVPGDVGEILRDLSEISRASLDESETGDAGEDAYIELVEFVRAGVQLAYDELADLREGGDKPASASH